MALFYAPLWQSPLSLPLLLITYTHIYPALAPIWTYKMIFIGNTNIEFFQLFDVKTIILF